MANFAITNGSSAVTPLTASTTYGGIITMGCSQTTPHRGKVYDLLVGTAAAPADNYMEFQVCRVTTVSTSVAAGTLTAAVALDSADAAALSLVTINSTGTATVTAGALWYIGMNQRASYRWVCAPGSELVWPATGSNGLSLQGKSGAFTGAMTGTVMFQEQ